MKAPGPTAKTWFARRLMLKKVPIVTVVRPFQEFAAREASGGIVLLACTVLALLWANPRWARSYADRVHDVAFHHWSGFGQ